MNDIPDPDTQQHCHKNINSKPVSFCHVVALKQLMIAENRKKKALAETFYAK
jgi:hypothetical protein